MRATRWVGLALLCLLILACGAAPEPPPAAAPAAATLQVALSPEPTPPADTGDPGPIPVTAADPATGNADALVTIVEFADFQCPFCGRVQPVITQLRQAYRPDQLRIVWKNQPLPFHDRAKPAAAAAMLIFERAGNAAFWAAHDAFFADQRRLDERAAEALDRAGLPPGETGGPGAQRAAYDKIDADMELAKRVGVTGTPAFLVNGVLVSGAQPFSYFAPIVDAQIKKAEALLERGTPRARVYAALTREQWSLPAPPKATPQTPPEEDRAVHLVPVSGSPVRGKATAPVTIVELAEFQCPFCGRAEATLAQVFAHYGDKVRLVWKNNPLPFHPRAEPAAELAVEARKQKGDKGFWAVHDLLFRRECLGEPGATDKTTCEGRGRTWVDNQTRLGDAELQDYARAIGLDPGRVAAAIAGKKHLGEIEEDQDLAEDLSAGGTPSFFINGRRFLGAQPFEKFQAVIDEELAKAEVLIKGGVPAAQVYDRIQAAAVPPKLPEKKVLAPPGSESPSRGLAGAKVVVQLFSDLECPACKNVVTTVEALDKAFPGKLRIVWRNRPLPSHPNAELAAWAVQEAYRQKGAATFWSLCQIIYAQAGPPTRQALDGDALALGLDPVKFARSLETGAHKPLVDADKAAADAAGIAETPAWVINGYYVAGGQLAPLRKVVRRALAEASGAPARP